MGKTTTIKEKRARRPLIKKLHGDKVIWIVVLLLALISVITVYSSSSSEAFRDGKPIFHYLFEQLGFVIAGLVALFLCYKIPLGWYRKISILGLILSVVLILLIYTPLGVSINGAERWIRIFGITFQPSEFAKIAIILYLARILETSNFDKFSDYLKKILLPVGVVCILSLLGSVSVFLIMATIIFVILLAAGIKQSHLWKTALIGTAILGVVFAIFLFTGEFKRIGTFTSRVERFFKDDTEGMSEKEIAAMEEKKFQEQQAVEALQLGKVFGLGPGNGIKRDILPHSKSDFIYAVIIEEMGLVGGIFVLLLYLWFFNRCIFIARRCTKVYSTVVVLGLGLLITLQALLHILVNVGILPVTGQTLPLVSSGGTSFIIMCCAFGIVLSVNRTIEVAADMTALGTPPAPAVVKTSNT